MRRWPHADAPGRPGRSSRRVPSGGCCGSAGWGRGDVGAGGPVGVGPAERRSTGNRSVIGRRRAGSSAGAREADSSPSGPAGPPAPVAAPGSAGTTPAGGPGRSIVSRSGNTPESRDQRSEDPGKPARCGPEEAIRRVITALGAALILRREQQWAGYPQFPQLYPQLGGRMPPSRRQSGPIPRVGLWITGCRRVVGPHGPSSCGAKSFAGQTGRCDRCISGESSPDTPCRAGRRAPIARGGPLKTGPGSGYDREHRCSCEKLHWF